MESKRLKMPVYIFTNKAGRAYGLEIGKDHKGKVRNYNDAIILANEKLNDFSFPENTGCDIWESFIEGFVEIAMENFKYVTYQTYAESCGAIDKKVINEVEGTITGSTMKEDGKKLITEFLNKLFDLFKEADDESSEFLVIKSVEATDELLSYFSRNYRNYLRKAVTHNTDYLQNNLSNI
jgi:hypothetical protein